MLIRYVLPVLLILLTLTRPVAAQTQITTGVIQGSVADATGASLPGVTVEARNVDTNLLRTQATEADGRFVFLQLPPGNYRVTFTLSGFATMVQENLQLTVGQAVTLPIVMKVSGVAETVTVTTGTRVIENVANRGGDDTESDDDRDDSDLGTQVRGSAHADAWRQHRAGRRRRRDQLRGSARHFQQHQPRRWRLQQRVLRRAGRWSTCVGGHHTRCGQRISGHRHRCASRIRPHRGRRRQRHHQVRNEHTARQPVPLPTAGSVDRRSVGRYHARQVPPRAVRWHVRRTDQERQSVRVRRAGRDQRDLRTSELEPADWRHAMSGAESDGHGERGTHQRQRRLSADRTPQLPPHPRRSRGRPASRAPGRHVGAARQSRSGRERKQQRLGIVELQSFAKSERDLRRADLRQLGQRHRRRSSADQCREPQLVHDALAETVERSALHLLAREPAAYRRRLWPSVGHRDWLQPVVPIRQSVFPATERRRVDLARAIQEQPLVRHRQTHLQVRRRVDAHAERSDLPRLLHRPVSVRQRERLPALCVAGGRGWIRSGRRELSEWQLGDAAGNLCRRCGGCEPLAAVSTGRWPDRSGDRRRWRLQDHQ